MPPIISIIIPHYNRPSMLSTLLDTIPDTDDIEVLVIDDISTKYVDEYNKCITNYTQNRKNITFYTNTKINKSPGGARNIGIDHATGKWLMFADSDDYFEPNWYTEVKKYTDIDVDIVYFLPTSIKECDGSPSNICDYYIKLVKNYISSPNTKNEWRLKTKFTTPWAKLIRRELMISTGLRFNRMPSAEDHVCMSIMALYIKSIKAVGVDIYCHLENAGSISVQKDDRTVRCISDSIEAVDRLYCRYLPVRIRRAIGYTFLNKFIWKPYLFNNKMLKGMAEIIGTKVQKILLDRQ